MKYRIMGQIVVLNFFITLSVLESFDNQKASKNFT